MTNDALSAEYETTLQNVDSFSKCEVRCLLHLFRKSWSSVTVAEKTVATAATNWVMAASNFFKATGGLVAAGAAVFGGQVCQGCDGREFECQ